MKSDWPVCYRMIAKQKQSVFIESSFMGLRRHLCKWLDLATIRFATFSMPKTQGGNPHLAEAAQLLASPDFYHPAVPPVQLSFDHEPLSGKTPVIFRFESVVQTPFASNNQAYGRFFACNGDWKTKPVLILLHGWNDTISYHTQFPKIARQLANNGVSSAILALPYHFGRLPKPPAPIRNFISPDVYLTVEAARQAVADIRALSASFLEEGAPIVGVWGVSLGGWLGGLALRQDSHIGFGVLMTPAARMDQLVNQLGFARPLREALQNHPMDVHILNLASKLPSQNPANILIVKGEYDHFIPPQSIEELWESWGHPEIWRLPHGHISTLCSPSVIRNTIRWVESKANNRLPAN